MRKSLKRSEESEEFAAAYAKALNLLANRDRFESEIRLKLEGFSDQAVAQVLIRLKNQHLIDDRRLVLRLIEANAGPKALANTALKAKCAARGASAESLKRFDVLEEGPLGPLLARFEPVPKNIGRAGRFLASRGYDEDAIQVALEGHFGTND